MNETGAGSRCITFCWAGLTGVPARGERPAGGLLPVFAGAPCATFIELSTCRVSRDCEVATMDWGIGNGGCALLIFNQAEMELDDLELGFEFIRQSAHRHR